MKKVPHRISIYELESVKGIGAKIAEELIAGYRRYCDETGEEFLQDDTWKKGRISISDCKQTLRRLLRLQKTNNWRRSRVRRRRTSNSHKEAKAKGVHAETPFWCICLATGTLHSRSEVRRGEIYIQRRPHSNLARALRVLFHRECARLTLLGMGFDEDAQR